MSKRPCKPFQIPEHWTDEMKDFVRLKYQKHGRVKCTKKFNKKFNCTYSIRMIMKVASFLGCSERESPEGYYTRRELSDIMGIARQNVLPYFERRGVKIEKFGRTYAIRIEDADPILQERFRPKKKEKPPWPAVTAQEAAKRVQHIKDNSVREAVNNGLVEHVRIDGKIFIRESDIQAAESYIRKTKRFKVPWKKLKEERMSG